MSSAPEIIPESDITPELDKSIRKQLVRCFPESADIFSKTRYYHNSVPSFSVMINRNDTVVAHLGVVRRRITVNGRNYLTAGVQNVFVVPEFRKTGLSDAVLQAAMRQAGSEAFDFGLLFTNDRISKVYARNGWQRAGNDNFYRQVNGELVRKPDESIKMYYPLKVKVFPPGDVYLNGNDW